MKSKKPVTEKGKRVVSDFERKYNSELEADESPFGDGARVKDTIPPMKNTYGAPYTPGSSKAPQYKDPSREAVAVFRKAYRRGDD
jgi:hypothetical protein